MKCAQSTTFTRWRCLHVALLDNALYPTSDFPNIKDLRRYGDDTWKH